MVLLELVRTEEVEEVGRPTGPIPLLPLGLDVAGKPALSEVEVGYVDEVDVSLEIVPVIE